MNIKETAISLKHMDDPGSERLNQTKTNTKFTLGG